MLCSIHCHLYSYIESVSENTSSLYYPPMHRYYRSGSDMPWLRYPNVTGSNATASAASFLNDTCVTRYRCMTAHLSRKLLSQLGIRCRHAFTREHEACGCMQLHMSIMLIHINTNDSPCHQVHVLWRNSNRPSNVYGWSQLELHRAVARPAMDAGTQSPLPIRHVGSCIRSKQRSALHQAPRRPHRRLGGLCWPCTIHGHVQGRRGKLSLGARLADAGCGDPVERVANSVLRCVWRTRYYVLMYHTYHTKIPSCFTSSRAWCIISLVFFGCG